ncbi:hypothetical protein DPMN_172010 [Dreissena polymorpha]|uniref:YqaJ viral recombinase domain-containing protein n=2 Tax=Dreissena polymorpha TaxID=45954 RepID=A0A9D4E2R7_DREPO|nr:hypothetical protein DPMN_172010 [Dreissena polymorpha]
MQWTCDAFVQDFLATPQQCQNLETMTRAQNNSLLWKRHREGRVTATVAHDILTLKPQTAPLAVINKVMKREQSNLSHIESVAFGLRYEGKAKEEYKMEMECLHEQFQLRECGLVVEPRFPCSLLLRVVSGHAHATVKVLSK